MIDENKSKYGKLINRVKAILIDGLVIIGLGVAFSSIFSKFDPVNNTLRMIAFVFIFLLYDPLFTSTIGATIGHMLMGLKVRQEKDETRKIIFPLALLRFVIKVTLGWISLMAISGSKKGRALHDSFAGSVVLQS
jgi:uncharacterized RDD family membrane protein YckC